MAEWLNLFELGECTVEVFDWVTETVAFSQVMARGDSAIVTESVTIMVDADGLVALEGADGISNAQFEIRIIPSYNHDFPARIRAVVVGENCDAAYGVLNATGDDGVDFLAFESVDPVSPDPLDMSDLPGVRDFVGFGFANSGIG